MSYFWSKKNFSDIDLTDMLVSYIKLINNSRMYYRCLVLTFQFLNMVSNNKKKKENWKSYIGFSIGYFGRSKFTKSHYNFKMLWGFFSVSFINWYCVMSCFSGKARADRVSWWVVPPRRSWSTYYSSVTTWLWATQRNWTSMNRSHQR